VGLMGKIIIYSGIREIIDGSNVEEIITRYSADHEILRLKLNDGRKLVCVDGLYVEPQDHKNLENNVRESLVKKLHETPMSFNETADYLLEELLHLATTEGEKLLVGAYKDDIRAYTHRTIAELMHAGTITERSGKLGATYGIKAEN